MVERVLEFQLTKTICLTFFRNKSQLKRTNILFFAFRLYFYFIFLLKFTYFQIAHMVLL